MRRSTGKKRLLTKPARETARSLLLKLQRDLRRASIDELIRLIGSEHFKRVKECDIRAVAQYGALEFDGEHFFERAFSTGKEAASSLALAHVIGPEVVLEDLRSLRSSGFGPDPLSEREPGAVAPPTGSTVKPEPR
ncbi:MAG: hypothetical protein GY725_24465 [bacterium]|nr:hypothetical protein [bacterium]